VDFGRFSAISCLREESDMQGRLMMIEFVTAVTGLMVLCAAVYGLIRLF
jgi:hypothetical protein